MKKRNPGKFLKRKLDYIIVSAVFIGWTVQWSSFPMRYVTLEEQAMISTLLKDFTQIVLAAASLIIPVAIGIVSYIVSKKADYTNVKDLISQFYQAIIILLLSVISGIYNMSYIPYLVIRKKGPNQYEDIFSNESVMIFTLFQLCTFILGLVKLFRGGHRIYKKV